MMSERDVFAALADPTRRQIIETLSMKGEQTATQFAEELPITRQGVSKHLAILEGAGVVTAEKIGRERRFSLNPESLDEPVTWVEQVKSSWDRRLQRLRQMLLDAEVEERS
jgi:DNA-binding transcriptional ArsR family regulator